MKPINNFVLIKPLPADEIRLSNGKKLYLDTRFEEYKNAPTSGTVVEVPSELKFRKSGVSMPWLTDMELQVGDTVIFNYLAVRLSGSAGLILEGGITPVPYDMIYAAIREGEVICVNGGVIVEPDQDEELSEVEKILENSGLSLPPSVAKKDKQTGVVRYAGKPNKGYLDSLMNDRPLTPDYQLVPGDKVLFHWSDAIPLQPNQEIRGEIERSTLYRMQHKDILAIKPA